MAWRTAGRARSLVAWSGRGHPALAHPGPLDDPLVGGVQGLFKIVVGQYLFRQITTRCPQDGWGPSDSPRMRQRAALPAGESAARRRCISFLLLWHSWERPSFWPPLSSWPAAFFLGPVLQGGLGRGQTGDGHPVGRAAHVVQAHAVAEVHAVRVAAVLTADAALEGGAGGAALSTPMATSWPTPCSSMLTKGSLGRMSSAT